MISHRSHSERCLRRLAEAAGDFGVDAIHLSAEIDGEFTVTLFQGKYRTALDKRAHFPETGKGKARAEGAWAKIVFNLILAGVSSPVLWYNAFNSNRRGVSEVMG